MAVGDRVPNRGYMPLNSDRDLPNNACQAPAAVKIGVTLLFSESSPLPAPLHFQACATPTADRQKRVPRFQASETTPRFPKHAPSKKLG